MAVTLPVLAGTWFWLRPLSFGYAATVGPAHLGLSGGGGHVSVRCLVYSSAALRAGDHSWSRQWSIGEFGGECFWRILFGNYPPRVSGLTLYGPQWAVLLLPFLAAAVVLAVRTRSRSASAARRRRAGRCSACGYDLRATPGRCPECGLAPRR